MLRPTQLNSIVRRVQDLAFAPCDTVAHRVKETMTTKPHVTIRQASIFDIDAVAPLFDAYRQFYRKPSDLTAATQFLLDRVRNGDSIVLTANTDDDGVVGFAQVYFSFSSVSMARVLILNDLFVVPEARHVGIGTRLLEEVVSIGKKMEAVRITLSTEANNVVAQALYKGKGWKEQTDFRVYNLSLSK